MASSPRQAPDPKVPPGFLNLEIPPYLLSMLNLESRYQPDSTPPVIHLFKLHNLSFVHLLRPRFQIQRKFPFNLSPMPESQ